MDEETQLVPVPEVTALTADEAATKVVAVLDMIAALIPDLRTPHPATAKRVRGARTVSREAVTSIIAMVEALPALQRLSTLDTNRAHQVLDSMDGLRLVAERLAMLQAQVKFTAEARWADLVSEAMAALAIAGGLAKVPAHAATAAHVATVRRHLGRTNKPKGKKKKTPSEE